MIRRPAVMTLVAIVALLIVSACSPTTRHRVLTFFFDGVPDPRGSKVSPDPSMGPGDSPDAQAKNKLPSPRWRELHVHPPYRENRCGSCHSTQTGQLFRPVTEGLCETCHRSLTDSKAYVHGPVAVSGCLNCHHYHSSVYPHVLLDEPDALCFNCHDQADTESAPHHIAAADQSCTDCHDPHGGDNRFFLTKGGA